MPFDRPHDLTVQLYSSKLPLEINASLVGFYQSGIPYTGAIFDGGDQANEPKPDEFNKYSKRTPSFKQVDISFSKYITLKDMKLSLGVNIFNVFDIRNIQNINFETGDPDTRSEYYTKEIKLPENGGTKSRSYYDTPWHYSSPRQINVFMRIDYK